LAVIPPSDAGAIADALPAGEIGPKYFHAQTSTASVKSLSALTQVGLITQRRDGTRLFVYHQPWNASGESSSGSVSWIAVARATLVPAPFSDLNQQGRRG